MKADTITIRQLFQDRRQYCVPFYQRAYVWTEGEQWQKLWEDVLEKAEAHAANVIPAPHFLGALVVEPQRHSGLMGVSVSHIIDGQQRITTLQFLLRAAVIELAPHIGRLIGVVEACIANQNEETMRSPEIERFKVWPTFRDQEAYRKAMTAPDLDSLRALFPNDFTQRGTLYVHGRHPAALHAIWFFAQQIREWINRKDGIAESAKAEALIEAILACLKVVLIELQEGDDAQVIFETLNGRGAKLNATDLIRNCIFMQAAREDSDSAALYDDYWTQFEQPYWSEPQSRGRMKRPRLEWFVHATLQATNKAEVDLGRLYHEYQHFAANRARVLPAQEQLETLSTFATPYKALTDGKGESAVARFGRRIRPFEATTIFPLALTIATSNADELEQHAIFDLMMSYVVRRAICNLTNKNYNNVFLSVIKAFDEQEVTAENMRSILSALSGEAGRWPRDNEFERACIEGTLYPGALDAQRTRSILAELEIHLRSTGKSEEPFTSDFSHLDIDHIMPTSWFEHWPLGSGEYVTREEADKLSLKSLFEELTERDNAIQAREQAIPRLGNLTLLNLSVNRSLQNKVFDIKRDKLIVNTNLSLNVNLIPLEGWDEEAIAKRGKRLADAAMRIWPGADVS